MVVAVLFAMTGVAVHHGSLLGGSAAHGAGMVAGHGSQSLGTIAPEVPGVVGVCLAVLPLLAFVLLSGAVGVTYRRFAATASGRDAATRLPATRVPCARAGPSLLCVMRC